MKIFVCKVCGHIEFNEIPEICLVCRADSKEFEQNDEAIKKPKDANALNDSEKKHIPVINIHSTCDGHVEGTGNCVKVKIGEIQHVMENEHYIRYLDYYHNEKFISRIWLSPEKMNPLVAISLTQTEGKVTVIENCNKHGNWMAEAQI